MPITAKDLLSEIKPVPTQSGSISAGDLLREIPDTPSTDWGNVPKSDIATQDKGEPTGFVYPNTPATHDGQTDWNQVDPKRIQLPADNQDQNQQYDVFQDAHAAVKVLSDYVGQGEKELTQSLKGAQYLYGEIAHTDFKPGIVEEIPEPKTFLAQNAARVFGPFAESLPALRFGVEGAAQGALLMGGVGAAVTLPEGGVGGIPLGAAGGISGLAVASGKAGAGGMYMAFRNAGLSDEQSRPAALAYGGVIGALNVMGLKVLGTSAEKVIAGYIAKAATKKGAAAVAERILINGGIQTGIGTVQGLMDHAVRTMVGALNGKVSLITQDWGKAFQDSLVKAALTGFPTAGLTEGGAHVIGAGARKFMTKKTPTIEDALPALEEAIANTNPAKVLQGRIEVNEQKAKEARPETIGKAGPERVATPSVRNSQPSNQTVTARPDGSFDKSGTVGSKVTPQIDDQSTRVAHVRKLNDENQTHALTPTKPSADGWERVWQAQQETDRKIVEQYKEWKQTVNTENKQNAIIKQAEQVVRVRKGSVRKTAAIKEHARKLGRDLTDEERFEIEQNKLLDVDDSTVLKERLQAKITKWVNQQAPWAPTFGKSFVNLAGKLHIAFQDVPNPEKLIAALDPHAATQKAATLRRQYLDMMYATLSKEVGLPKSEVIKLIAKSVSDPISGAFHNRKYLAGKRGPEASTPFHLHADEAISFLMWMKNKKARRGLTEGNGYTLDSEIKNGESTETAIRNALREADPNYLKLVTGIEKVYDHLGPALKKAFEEAYPDETLDLEEGYGGRIYRKGGPVDNPARADLELGLPWQSVGNHVPDGRPGFTQERAGTEQAIEPKGAFNNLEGRILRQAQFEAMAMPSKLWKLFVENNRIKSAMDIKFPGLLKSIENNYRDIIHGASAANQEHINFIDHLLRAKMVQTLMVKPLQSAKHALTYFNFSLYKYNGEFIPPAKLISGTQDFYRNFTEAVKEVSSWDAVKNRYAELENTALGAVTKSQPQSLEIVKLQQIAMKPFELGDKAALYPGAYAVYKYVLEKTGSKETATFEAGKALNDVLASGSMDQLSDMSRSRFLKIWAQFQQPVMRLAQHNLEAARKAANFPTEQNVKNAAYSTVATHVVAALFVAPEIAYTYAITRDEKRREEALWHFWSDLRLGANFPGWSDALHSAHSILDNAVFNEHHRVFEPQIITTDVASKSLHFIGHMTDGKTWTPKKVFNTAIEAIQGPGAILGLPIPIEQPTKLAKDIFTDDQSPFYMGWMFNSPPPNED